MIVFDSAYKEINSWRTHAKLNNTRFVLHIGNTKTEQLLNYFLFQFRSCWIPYTSTSREFTLFVLVLQKATGQWFRTHFQRRSLLPWRLIKTRRWTALYWILDFVPWGSLFEQYPRKYDKLKRIAFFSSYFWADH